MRRIPLSKFPTLDFDDQDIIDAYDWFRSFLSLNDWMKIKSSIENYLTEIFEIHDPAESMKDDKLLVINKNRIGWYLYLVYTYIYEQTKYEHFQGARVLPIFKRLGSNLDSVKQIKGIEKRVRDLLRKRPSEADAVLFEILTGLVWVSNGWEVETIDENKGNLGKTPDFLASKGNESWQVECKRQSKTSDYAYAEQQKKLDMINEANDILLEHDIFLVVTFHVELTSLPKNYLKDLLLRIIPNFVDKEFLLKTTEIDVVLKKVDILQINKHLNINFVKHRSPQILELIAGRPVDHLNLTIGIRGESLYVGEGVINNRYYSEVSNAFGVEFFCDADASLLAKARDIKKQIHNATKQFDISKDAIIHVGMETSEGPEVERVRLEKILQTMDGFDPTGNSLCWVFCHYFQSYSRSEMNWYYDETVQILTTLRDRMPPIPKHFLIIPEDEVTIIEGSHWERDIPE